jgi:glycosyltransferase involved in cell wall biosynthesis
VIYAVYKTSSGSANSLTKSAFFRRPILVSNQSYIGELVKDAGIGLAVPPDDLNEIYRGVTTLIQDRLSDANYARFSERNSTSMLELALDSALVKWCN